MLPAAFDEQRPVHRDRLTKLDAAAVTWSTRLANASTASNTW